MTFNIHIVIILLTGLPEPNPKLEVTVTGSHLVYEVMQKNADQQQHKEKESTNRHEISAIERYFFPIPHDCDQLDAYR